MSLSFVDAGGERLSGRRDHTDLTAPARSRGEASGVHVGMIPRVAFRARAAFRVGMTSARESRPVAAADAAHEADDAQNAGATAV
jgi:hypothetical protein